MLLSTPRVTIIQPGGISSVQQDQTLMYKISDLDKEKIDNLNYTGLRTFDVQFDCGN